MTYQISFAAPARRALSEDLPPAVAAAALELIAGAIAENPRRVGKPLKDPYQGRYAARRGTYRVVYRIAGDTVRIEAVRPPRSWRHGLSHQTMLTSVQRNG